VNSTRARSRRTGSSAESFAEGERSLTPDAQPNLAEEPAGLIGGRQCDAEVAFRTPDPVAPDRDVTALDPVVPGKLGSESDAEREIALEQVAMLREIRSQTFADISALAAPTNTKEWGPYYDQGDVDRILNERLKVTIVSGKVVVSLDLGKAGGGVQQLAEAGLASLPKSGTKTITKQLLKLAGASATVLKASGLLVSLLFRPVELGRGDQVRWHMTDEEILALIVRRLADRADAERWLEAQRLGAGRDAAHDDTPIGRVPEDPTVARDVTARKLR